MITAPEQEGQEGLERATRALSRALYRRLTDAPADGMPPRARQRVLDACELTMRRIAEEPHFARPSRFLFEELRPHFPLYEQLWVRTVVDSHVAIARELIGRLPSPRRECGATTRAGDPCRRQALQGSEFCPSHRRLYEAMGSAQVPAPESAR